MVRFGLAVFFAIGLCFATAIFVQGETLEDGDIWCETVHVYDGSGNIRTNCSAAQFSATFKRTTSFVPSTFYPSNKFQDMGSGHWSMCSFNNLSSGNLRAFVSYSGVYLNSFYITVVPDKAKPSDVTR